MLEVDLADELVFTLVGSEDREHVILAGRNESSLIAGYSGAFSRMGLNDELEITLLVPNVDATVGSTRVADAVFVKNGGVHLGLLEFGSKGTILEQLLAAVSRIPKLERPRSHSDKFEIICFSGPLNIVDGIGAGRNIHQLLVPLDVEDVHDVVVALVDSRNVPLARADRERSHTLSLWPKREARNRLHGV